MNAIDQYEKEVIEITGESTPSVKIEEDEYELV